MTKLINRPEYMNQLIQNRDVDLVKIVTGIRRCGKSSLLDLFHQYTVQWLYRCGAWEGVLCQGEAT